MDTLNFYPEIMNERARKGERMGEPIKHESVRVPNANNSEYMYDVFHHANDVVASRCFALVLNIATILRDLHHTIC